MKRTKKFLAIALMIVFSGLASAEIILVENANEAGVASTTLPTYSGGQIVIQSCAECQAQNIPVNTATKYYIGVEAADNESSDQSVSLAELRQEIATGDHELIYIYHSVETGVATRVVLSLQ